MALPCSYPHPPFRLALALALTLALTLPGPQLNPHPNPHQRRLECPNPNPHPHPNPHQRRLECFLYMQRFNAGLHALYTDVHAVRLARAPARAPALALAP